MGPLKVTPCHEQGHFQPDQVAVCDRGTTTTPALIYGISMWFDGFAPPDAALGSPRGAVKGSVPQGAALTMHKGSSSC